MENMDKYLDQLVSMAVEYGPKLVSAVLTLIIGLWIIRMITGGLAKVFRKRAFDPSLESFLLSLSGIVLKVLLFVSVAGMVGIQMTSFVAILGAAGLAIGMAMSGTLGNFAGGVMILIFKPYKIGDFVEMQGYSGSVKDIQIFITVLTTGDNKTIFIPNGPISTGSMINYSTQPKRRVDFVFGIGYDDDIDKARATILKIVDADERVHKDPKPLVVVSSLGDNAVNLTVRVWADAPDYWGVFFGTTEAVKKTFDAEGISFPYPQRDVHLHQSS